MNIYLKVPNVNELHYRKMWMQDPKTMEYNAGYDIQLNGYDTKTGTIVKSDEEMISWYENWVNKEPDKYFAYIYVYDIDEPIGEIYYYLNDDIYSMGILICNKYRGKGYSYDALTNLETIAFEKNKISELSDFIPLDRTNAIKTFEKAGFIKTKNSKIDIRFNKANESRQMIITKADYLKKRNMINKRRVTP